MLLIAAIASEHFQLSLIYTGIDKHTGENVGLYSTVISRADYDAMAGQLAVSMQAAQQSPDDIPDRPVFSNISADDEEKEIEVPHTAKQLAQARGTIVQKSASTVTPSVSTYRPAYVPPQPAVAPVVQKKPQITVDTSMVHAGTIVKHHAFGKGEVKGIDGAVMVVVFNGVDKRFQFPGAFEQGFLKIVED